ncbi:hypothetical protein CALVIDRAFT_17428 [Calocera viscosa TUFC12733]|uniref:F-box domain-containing protein n=1 Tax=Calocera viscosa (strain TUFC12733) TaxID=1330018 RepID=A0A167SBM8_CALVF|nr:hypothetical protein CALVIDRAFT_17428 [Calocera viscosa TUFC12733]
MLIELLLARSPTDSLLHSRLIALDSLTVDILDALDVQTVDEGNMSDEHRQELPAELIIHVLEHLPPSTILRLRCVSKQFNALATSRSLWLSILTRLPPPVPLPLKDADAAASLPVDALIRLTHGAYTLASNFASSLPIPRRTLKLKELHQDRVTCVAILPGGRFLFTGSVDGWIRCWDLTTLREVKHSQPVNAGNIGRVAQMNMEVDVSALEVQWEGGGAHSGAAIVVVGSYYSVESCRVFRILLPSPGHDYVLPHVPAPRFTRSSFFPLGSLVQNWCGTQSVALEGDIVAVGGHLSPIQVLNWRTGIQSVLQVPEGDRRSVAVIKILPPWLVSVTRLGQVELFRLPQCILADDPADVTSDAAGTLIASHALPLPNGPVTSVSISSQYLYPSAPGAPRRYHPLTLLVQQRPQSSLFKIEPLPTHPDPELEFPYTFPPTAIATHPHPPTQLPESASLAASGLRCASTSSIRDFMPFNRLLLWSPSPPPLPVLGAPAPAQTAAASSSDPSSQPQPQPPCPSPAITRCELALAPRTVKDDIRDPESVWMWEESKDLYAEVALEEELGRVVVGTARGGCWVFDF